MQFDHVSDLRVDDPAADAFEKLAGRIATGRGFVPCDPRYAIRQSFGRDRPDSRTRFHMITDSDPPGLGADSCSKTSLLDAHLDVEPIGAHRIEACTDGRLRRIKKSVSGQKPKAGRSSIQPEIPFAMFLDKPLNPSTCHNVGTAS